MKSFSKYAMLISTFLLCGMLCLFLGNLRSKFRTVEVNYLEHHSVNLSQAITKEELESILVSNGYVTRDDAGFIADTISSRLKHGLKYPNLYYLQKRAYGQVSALAADSAKVLKETLEDSYKRLGLKINLDSIRSTCNLNDGDGKISVQIYSKEQEDSCSNILVILSENHIDPVKQACSDVLAYYHTDSVGNVTFSGLDRKKSYSVLPIRKGFEYGTSKGIKEGKFDKNFTFRFLQLEHRIPMIDNATLKQIKNDGTITVRTPAEFKAEVVKWFIIILLAWWSLAIIMTNRKRKFDPLLLSTAMFLTGLCVIIMYAIQNPLTEELRGTEMAIGVLIGISVIILFQFVDFVKLYQCGYKFDFDIPLSICKWFFLPFKQKVSWLVPILKGYTAWYKKMGAILLLILCLPFAIFNLPIFRKINKRIFDLLSKMPKGFGWLMLAIVLTSLLWTPLGKAIGGMKVNLSILGLTFQPSEIAKYLILFFMAAFFTQHADTIIAYSQPNHTRVWEKIKTLGWAICGLISLMLIYAGLGDLGPALVIGITFVLLYSLIKSKVNLDNLSDTDKWKRIFTCDFAMLIYGVISFAAFVLLGFTINSGVKDIALLFGILWFIAWIFFGYTCNKQFFESAFLINILVFVFIFGGDLASHIDQDIADRFEERTSMCVNTWGNLDIEHSGEYAVPVSNTQVANGLWAIATGGMWGQGLGNGNPNLIPAFHTDMILSSLAEQIGWWGLLLVVLAIALLLRRMVVVGYKVGHPFAFYFCMGVAIVTAVQFFIISLGSSGIIPLTGITVPFLSYGKVSMILNLSAFGIILSLSKNIKTEKSFESHAEVRKRSVFDYNYPISIVTWTFIFFAVLTLCVWQNYALWSRSNTLVHPAYVHSRNGVPIIDYNPRIALLTREMWAGDIYDCKGKLLATSDNTKLSQGDTRKDLLKAGISAVFLDSISRAHTKRYYPFGEHLYFMLGDINSGLYLNSPIGYMAESRHLSYLRDYDNTYYDSNHEPVKLNLKGKIKSSSKYVESEPRDTIITYNLRDNSALVKYLRTGVQGRPLKRHNEKVRDKKLDLHLTIDAELQRNMQERLEKYVANTPRLNENNLLRISVVILDAENGELLTSANYPLPDYTRLRKEEKDAHERGKRYAVYSDNYREDDWEGAYTERDLGLTYSTYPGSTAKVMSAIAGLQQMGSKASDKKYYITVDDIIEKGDAQEPIGVVSMRDAIVKSSNCYFIHLVNENNLYLALDSVYESAGVSIGAITPYRLNYEIDIDRQNEFREKIRQNQSVALAKYEKRVNEGVHENMNKGEWRWAWGQGYQDFELRASPLNMARVVSAVVNNGKMPYTKYLLGENKYEREQTQSGYCQLLRSSEARILSEYMKAESANQRTRNNVSFPSNIGGKTGTPERSIIEKSKSVYSKRLGRNLTRYYNSWKKVWSGEPSKRNDGWYMFFVEGQDDHRTLAVCVRMERSNNNSIHKGGSGSAVRLSKSVILESLYSCGYIKEK